MGVKGATVLMLLPKFDLICSFVPDYMHCVLFGVVRQFVSLWLDSSSDDKPVTPFVMLDPLTVH